MRGDKREKNHVSRKGLRGEEMRGEAQSLRNEEETGGGGRWMYKKGAECSKLADGKCFIPDSCSLAQCSLILLLDLCTTIIIIQEFMKHRAGS